MLPPSFGAYNEPRHPFNKAFDALKIGEDYRYFSSIKFNSKTVISRESRNANPRSYSLTKTTLEIF